MGFAVDHLEESINCVTPRWHDELQSFNENCAKKYSSALRSISLDIDECDHTNNSTPADVGL